MTLIEGGKQKTKEKQEGMQSANQDNKKNILPFISTCNPKNLHILSVILSNFQILENNDEMKAILDHDLIGHRQPKNIKQIQNKQNPN